MKEKNKESLLFIFQATFFSFLVFLAPMLILTGCALISGTIYALSDISLWVKIPASLIIGFYLRAWWGQKDSKSSN
jgi:hypothetical protein